MKKTKIRLIAAFLATIISFEILPVEAAAIEWSDLFGGSMTSSVDQDTGNPIAEENEEEAVTVVGELEDQRDLNTKSFRLSNGTITAVQYETDVHYQDEDGAWMPIDNSLEYEDSSEDGLFSLFSNDNEETDDVQDTDGYTTKDGSVNFKFAKNANQKNLVRIQQGNYKLSFTLQDRNENKKVDIQQGVENLDDGSLASQMTAPNVYSSVVYRNIQDDVDIQYIASGSDLKENIIVNSKRDSYDFTFEVKAQNLSMIQEEDGSVSLYDSKSNELVYTIPIMYMTDNLNAQSDSITYTLTQKNKKKYEFTVHADAEWINADEREFPVTIDPTLNTQTTGIGLEKVSVFNYYSAEGGSVYHNGNGFLGYDSGGDHTYCHVVQFKNLPSLPRGSVIVNAKIYYAQIAYSDIGMSSLCIKAREIPVVEKNYAWGATKKWADLPERNDTVLDYKMLSKSTNNSYVDWDITSLVKKRYESDASNIPSYSSFALEPYNKLTSKSCAKATINQSNTKGYFSNGQPILQITYRDTRGIEDYYTNSTQSIGQAGTAYIGDYNDQLTLVKNDLTNTGSVMNFVLSHVYNSAVCYANFTRDANMHTMKYSGMNIGRGWRLSVQETVVKQVIGSTTYYIYSDGDGTEHYFYYDTEKKKYVDEDGLNLTLSFWTNSTTKYVYATMQDKKGNQKVFINGYLSKIQDSFGNQIFITYHNKPYSPDNVDWQPKIEPTTGTIPQNRVTGIVQRNNGKTAFTIATLTYSKEGYLETVTDRAGRTTKYEYTTVSNDTAKNLTTITHPDGTTAEYKYQSGGYLIDAYDAESRNGVTYTYYAWPVRDVLTVTEYSIDAAGRHEGAKMSIGSADTNRTVFRDYGADATSETADDIITYQMFDNAARTVNTCSLDVTRNKLLGADCSAYTNNSTSNSSTNNRVTADVATGLHAVNLLTNSSGEDANNGIATSWSSNTVGTNVACAVRNDSLKRTGNNGFKVWMDSSAAPDEQGNLRGSHSQSVRLNKGKTYSFSGYVKTSQCTDTNADNRKAYLDVLNENGQSIAKSKKIDYLTPTSIENGWERLSVTFTPTQTGYYTVCANSEFFVGLSYWDDFQLEEGEASSSYNMLDDGDFEHGGWNYTTDGNVSFGGKALISSLGGFVRGNSYVEITGEPTAASECRKQIPINQTADNTYVISGWAKGNSVPDATKTAERYFGLQATIHYADGTKESFTFPFNADITDWQYISGIIAPKKGYDSTTNAYKTISTITVHCIYARNANTARFDDICLKKEPAQTYTYDKEGNLTAVNQIGNNPMKSVYEAGTADLKSEEDGTGKYTYEHDKTTHAVTSVSNDNIKLSLNYDSVGNTTGTTLVNTKNETNKSLTSTALYSADGNYMTSQTDTSGITSQYTYMDSDPVWDRQKTGLVTRSQDSKGTVTKYAYNTNNDRQTMTYIEGKESVGYNYAQGNLASIVRGGYLPAPNNSQHISQTYSFTYDSFGNKTSVKVGNKTLATYEYAPNNGNLIKTTYGNGNYVELVYDIFDRVVEEKYNGTTKYKYVYNGEGDLAKKIEVNAQGNAVNTTGYEYDGLDRLIHSWEERVEGENITEVQRSEHMYDGENRIKKQSWSVGGNTQRTESYTYSDVDGTLINMTTANGETIAFGYDKLKRLETISGVTGQKYTYRDIDNTKTTTQISDITYTGVTDNLKLSYIYDAGGNIDSIKQNNKTIAEYSYDAQNQLVEENLPMQHVRYEYVYDTCHNIRQVKKYENGSTTPTVTEYGYENADWLDLLTSYNGQAITYDNIGNPLTYNNGTAWTFTWQGAHDLATATANGQQIAFHYDMDGVRDNKTITDIATGIQTNHEYITQNGKVVLERWNDGEAKSLEFIYDNSQAPYSVIYKHGDSKPEIYYYILNQQGDVIRIVDGTGATKAEYTYNGWGEILDTYNAENCNIGTLNPIRYRGYYYDAELNVYYLQSRYYDPVVKRMLCADDESLMAGASLNNNNLFSYCDNNPIIRVDDDGDFWNVAIGAAIGVGLELSYQIVVEGKRSVSDIDWVSVAGAGASSAIGAASFGPGVQFIANAAIGAATQAINDRNKSLSTKERVANIVGSAAAAGASTISIRGSIKTRRASISHGTNKNKVYTKAVKGSKMRVKRELRRSNQKIARKRISQHKSYISRTVRKFTRYHFGSTFKSYLKGKFYYKIPRLWKWLRS